MSQQSQIIEILTGNVDMEIPLVHLFSADICVRGIHFYNVQPNLGAALKFYPEDDPMSLVQDRYAVAVKIIEDGRKIGHVPRFMSKLLFFFLRNGGNVSRTVIGSKQYSWDLPQGGVQIPVKYTFIGNQRIVNILKTKILQLIEEHMMVA